MNRRASFWTLSLVGLAMLSGPLTGCGGKPLTRADYEKLQPGMSEAEVVAILGKGTELASSDKSLPPQTISTGKQDQRIPGYAGPGKMLKWQSGDHVIIVVISNGKLVSKSAIGIPL